MIQISPADFINFLGVSYEPKRHFIFPEGESGAVFMDDGRILCALASILGGDVLEIGTDNGVSARFISEGLDLYDAAHSGKFSYIHTVDIFQRVRPSSDWPRIIPRAMPSANFPVRPFKWAFIDGDHRFAGVTADAKKAVQCSCQYIIFHDTGPNHKKNPDGPTAGSDAREAVPAFFSETDWDIWDISTHCGMMYVRMKGAIHGA